MDISDTLDQKIEACIATWNLPPEKHAGIGDLLRRMAAEQGRAAGIEYAEPFERPLAKAHRCGVPQLENGSWRRFAEQASNLSIGDRVRLLCLFASKVYGGTPDFLKLWSGRTVSGFGSRITFLALPLTAILVLDATPLQMGILSAVGSVPSLILGLGVGVWVDRWRKRPVLIAANYGRALLLLAIPIAAVFNVLRIEHLYAFALGVGVMGLFFGVASRSMLPSLVSRDQLVEANSKLAIGGSAADVAGPWGSRGVDPDGHGAHCTDRWRYHILGLRPSHRAHSSAGARAPEGPKRRGLLQRGPPGACPDLAKQDTAGGRQRNRWD